MQSSLRKSLNSSPDLLSDGEVGGGTAKEGGVGEGGPALAIAQNELGVVHTSLEGLLLAGLSLEGELGLVLTGGKALIELAITERLVSGGLDVDHHLASGGLVVDSEGNVHLEGGADGAACGGHSERVDLELATIVHGAGLKLLAEEDGVDVLAEALDQVDEAVDTHTVAQEVADLLLALLVGESSLAKLPASANHTDVEDSVQELVDSLGHELVAKAAEGELKVLGVPVDLGHTIAGDLGVGNGQYGNEEEGSSKAAHLELVWSSSPC